MAKLVSKVYGDALFEAAMERDMLSPVYEEVQSLQTILMENADLVQFLNHPQIIKEEKLKVVENIFKGRVSDDLMGFLETVIEKGRQKESQVRWSSPRSRRPIRRRSFWRQQLL